MKRSRLLTAAGWLAPTWLVLAWVYRGLLVGGEVSFRRDTLLVFLPLKQWLAEGLGRGELTEWWPFDGLGQPLTSLPIASVFHPTTVLYAVLPLALAFTVQTLLPLVVMPLGTWLLARTLGLRAAGAGLAAGLVGVSFWSYFLSEQTQMHLAAAALPWFWREALRLHRSRRGSVVVLALATGNMVVGGDPMLLEIATLALLPLVGRWPLRLAPLGRVGAGLGLGLALGGVQLVPMLYAFAESPRAAGLSLAPGDYWALRLREVPGFVLPIHHGPDYLYDAIYVGVPTLLLAGAALLAPWRFRWRLAGLVLLLGLVATGPAGVLWTVLGQVVPGWRGFQFPLKTIGPALVPLALLAGRGLERARVLRWVWVACVASGAALLAAAVPLASLQAVGGLLGWLAQRRPGLGPALTRAVVAVLVLEVALQVGAAPSWPLAEVLKPTPVARVLAEAGVSLERGTYEWDYKVSLAMDRRAPQWRDAQTELQLLTVAPSTGALFGLPVARPYLAGQTRRVFELRQSPEWASRLAPLFGVVAHVGWYEGDVPPRPNLAEDTDLGAVVHRVENARPRAYLARDVLEVEETAQVDALERLAPARGGAIVVAPGAVALRAEPGRALEPVALTRGIDALSVEVETAAPAMLVVNEAWARGWSVSLDGGEATRPVPVNHAVLGVLVPAGRHRVLFRYETPGLALGLAVSATAAAALGAWGLSRRRRQRALPGRVLATPS